jgi:hypothetical protein
VICINPILTEGAGWQQIKNDPGCPIPFLEYSPQAAAAILQESYVIVFTSG